MNMPWIKTCAHGVPVEIDADAYPSVVALFDAAVARFADLPAFECLGSTMTYAEIDRASRAVAAYLQQELGVRRGDRVALMAPNVPAFPIVMLGVLRAGAAQVNVNPLYTPRELAHQLNDAGVETIVIFGGSTPTLAEIIDQTPVKTVITLDLGDGSGLAMPSPAVDPRLTSTLRLADVLAVGATLPFEPVALTGDDILFFQYTGGTTGLSKGAVLFHRNLVANIEQFKAFLPDDDAGLRQHRRPGRADPEPARHGWLHHRHQGREVLGAPRCQHPVPGAGDAPALQGSRPLQLQDRNRRRVGGDQGDLGEVEGADRPSHQGGLRP
ncbi:MAG: long-chain-fatty-acid--CoA ligase, partial [Geminicoccaceae bacterium]|nr:long-chain-fatty-acid--CoA ligase [Geminicoccaceae bacterium]